MVVPTEPVRADGAALHATTARAPTTKRTKMVSFRITLLLSANGFLGIEFNGFDHALDRQSGPPSKFHHQVSRRRIEQADEGFVSRQESRLHEPNLASLSAHLGRDCSSPTSRRRQRLPTNTDRITLSKESRHG